MSIEQFQAVKYYVYVIQSGDYEQWHIDTIGTTRESAVAALKAEYASPYIVRWEESGAYSETDRIIGYFEEVPDYSTEHTEEFTISAMEVHGEQ